MKSVPLDKEGALPHCYVTTLWQYAHGFKQGNSPLNKSMGEWAEVIASHAARIASIKNEDEKRTAIEVFHAQRRRYHAHVTQMDLCCEAFKRNVIPSTDAQPLMERLQNTQVLSQEGKSEFAQVARQIFELYKIYAPKKSDKKEKIGCREG